MVPARGAGRRCIMIGINDKDARTELDQRIGLGEVKTILNEIIYNYSLYYAGDEDACGASQEMQEHLYALHLLRDVICGNS